MSSSRNNRDLCFLSADSFVMGESEASRRRREIFPFFRKMILQCIIVISKRQHETNHHIEAREIFSFPFSGSFCDGEELLPVEPETKSSWSNALQRTNTENSKQILPERELRGHRPNSCVCGRFIFIFIFLKSICLNSAYSAAGNMWTDSGNI